MPTWGFASSNEQSTEQPRVRVIVRFRQPDIFPGGLFYALVPLDKWTAAVLFVENASNAGVARECGEYLVAIILGGVIQVYQLKILVSLIQDRLDPLRQEASVIIVWDNDCNFWPHLLDHARRGSNFRSRRSCLTFSKPLETPACRMKDLILN